MVRFIGGFPVNPVQPGLLSDALIYRPEYGGTGLLNDGADFANLRSTFAGGMLDGFQIDPVTGMPMTVSPSGVFRPGQGEMQQPGGGEEPPKGAFSITDLMELQSSLSQANFGNQDVQSVFSAFVDKGNGTFDIDPDQSGGIVNMGMFGTNEAGERVPMNLAVHTQGPQKGQQIGKQAAMGRMASFLSGIDESGGGAGDGGDGAP